MTAMSRIEAAFCRSPPWRLFAGKVVLPWAAGGVPGTGWVLEIGAGSGAMAEQLLRRQPLLRLTACDVDVAMARRTGARLARFGTRASVMGADAAALPFEDASFDTVVSWLMLHHTIAWERVLVEVRRVLRPGGTFVGYDLLDTRAARLVHRLDGSDHRLFRLEDLDGALRQTFAGNHTDIEAGRLLCRFSVRA